MLRQRRPPNSGSLLPHHHSFSSDGSFGSSRPRQRKRALQRLAVLGVVCLSVFILAGTGVIRLSSPFRAPSHSSHEHPHSHRLHEPRQRQDQEQNPLPRIAKKEKPLDEMRGLGLQKEEDRVVPKKKEKQTSHKQPQATPQKEPPPTKPQEPPPTKPQEPPPTKPQEPPPTKPQEPPPTKPQEHPQTKPQEPLIAQQKEPPPAKPKDMVALSPHNVTFVGHSTTHIICPDGSTGILNDNYCDCSDGSDETRTSACSHLLVNRAVFLCRNGSGSIFASRVGDGIVDCLDGSDEQKAIENGNLRLASFSY